MRIRPNPMASTGSCVTNRQDARVSRNSVKVSPRTNSRRRWSRPENRFIHQHHLRPRHHGACQRHTLLFAAREMVRIVSGKSGKAHTFEGVNCDRAGILARQALQPESHIVEDQR